MNSSEHYDRDLVCMCSTTYDVVTVQLTLCRIYQFYLRTQKIFPNHSELHPNSEIIDHSVN